MGLENLQTELIIEILMRLPVKSLVCFRCVSKEFNSIIGSRYFIQSHLKVTLLKKNHRRLIYRENKFIPGSKEPKTYINVLDIYDGSKLEFPFFTIPALPNFIPILQAHCNGLVLVGSEIRDLTVWNPSTRRIRELPVCPLEIRLGACGTTKFGFGYDSSTDDYKVVLIKEIKFGLNINEVEVWIFGLKSGSWRKIQDFPYPEYQFTQDAEKGNCFVDGALHFLCRGRYNSHVIVAFDLGKETFSILSQPVYETRGFPTRLQVFEGCLCIGFCSYFEDEFELYVRRKKKDRSIEFNWSKLFSTTTQYLSFLLRHGNLLGFSKDGDKILVFYDKHMYSYGVIDKSIKEVLIKNNNIEYEMYLDSFLCIDSLVLV